MDLTDIHVQRNMPKRYDPEKHLDKKIRVRIVIYFVIALVLIGIVIYHIIVDRVLTLFPLFGLMIGFAIGLFMSRISHISWDKGAKQAISQTDTIGVIILIGYIVFEIYRDEIVEHFVQGPAVVATSFALFAGVMIGRIIGIRGRIKEVVTENLKR